MNNSQGENGHDAVTPDKGGLTPQQLKAIVQAYHTRSFSEEINLIEELGGLDDFQRTLVVCFDTGLSELDFGPRIEQFGHNQRASVERRSFLDFCLDALKDKIMIILLVLGVLTLVIEVLTSEHVEYAWIEGFAIIIAVVVVVLVTGTNDFQKHKKFQQLQEVQLARQLIQVLRHGKLQPLHPSELLVGDIVEVSDGNVIPADGLMISGDNIEVDESVMTGENDKRKKVGFADAVQLRNLFLKDHPNPNTQLSHELPSPVCISGTTLVEGRGRMLVVAVGKHSSVGSILALTQVGSGTTPLEDKLDSIADFISKIGLVCGALAVFVMFSRLGIELLVGNIEWNAHRYSEMLKFVVVGITVLVVAIPEGLPLAVTISLAYSVSKMQKENNLVKRLAACETMGGADVICSDKTGTLTENTMRAEQLWFDGKLHSLRNYVMNSPAYSAQLTEAICATTHAFIQEDKEHGSKTEIALLRMLLDFGSTNYLEIRKELTQNTLKVFPFSSVRKRSSIVLKQTDGGARVYVIGASEILIEFCQSLLSANGDVSPLTLDDKVEVQQTIVRMAEGGLRTICIATRSLAPGQAWDSLDATGAPTIESQGLTCLAIVGIADPVRKGVPEAVQICKTAHINVKMVTGDNKITAKTIAQQCGILTNDDGVMEGAEFCQRVGGVVCSKCHTHECDCSKDGTHNGRKDEIGNLEEFKRIVPHLDVLARSQPEHKYVLVTGLIQLGHVVAVTGDGTNDAPALKKADVGFAMGISGTEHAREAADIILLDDNFSSIVNAIRWGRNIYDSIQKFIQFQLTVNVVAVSAAIVGAVTIKQSPLTAVQMLWVNLIMDTFASLALATETPTDEQLQRRPHCRQESIVSKTMWKHILGQAFLQCMVIFTMMFLGEEFLIEDATESQRVRKHGSFVVSGRLFNFDGSEDYIEYYEDPEVGPSRHFTMIFHTFVLFQLVNELNSRVLQEKLWVFSGVCRNSMFLSIWAFTVVFQGGLIYVGGYAVSCHFDGLTGLQWCICLGFALTSLFWRVVLVSMPSRVFKRLESVGENQLSRKFTATLRRNNHSSDLIPHT